MTRAPIRTRILGLTMMALAASAGVAVAGPPLLCHPFDIGTAQSLPWDGRDDWRGRASAGNLQTLVADTQALLTPATPVIVRMETLRRAALYASRDPNIAKELFEALGARVGREASASASASALATFDAGYFAETLRQIADLGTRGDREMAPRAPALLALVQGTDGYALIQKSLRARAGDPAIEFAAALVSVSGSSTRGAAPAHAQKAKAGQAQDTLLARNIGHLAGL